MPALPLNGAGKVDRGIIQAKLAAAYGGAQGVSAHAGSDLDAVIALITAEHAKALMIELARVPSPLTALLEAEPQLRAFIDNGRRAPAARHGPDRTSAATAWAICWRRSAATRAAAR